jgi:hypothetical protein
MGLTLSPSRQIMPSQMDAAMVESAQAEAALYRRLDHPNCHYMIGAKTTLVQIHRNAHACSMLPCLTPGPPVQTPH